MSLSKTISRKTTEEFQSTDIGDFPKSWDISSLGDLFDLQQGKALSQKARTGISPRPFLRTINVLWGRVDLTFVDQMDFTEEEFKKLSLKKGDLLVCEGGEIGRSAVWDLTDEGFCCQNHVHRLRRKTDGIIPEFVMYWLQAGFLHLRIYGGVGNKTTIPNLSGTKLKQLLMPVPPLSEQKAIAAILSKVQDAIEIQEKIVAKLRELRSATMAKLFREGLRGELLKQTEIGEIPESWEVVCIGDLIKLSSGNSRPTDLSPERTTSTPFPVYGGNGVMGYTSQNLTACESIVIGRVGAYCGSIHVCPVYSWITDNALFHRNPISEKASLFFLAELFEKLKFNELRRQGAQPLITQGIINGVKISLPSKLEQEEIALFAILLNKKINVSEQKNKALKVLFSTTLHQLMTGQLRVNQLKI
jgi:type I restriction enzyme S subunit